ncbi:esterase [Methylovulum psychrotolerans]|uniref:Esterase n=1 Tax=Methylovulum psychrotolerans TaxID=1704499 RepID=A0A1Z4BWT9_9GAMM|nr:esterase [Methylovulum psychrotolerans]ASF45710.1 esterase [Methylovulum psychrotolerans]POZ52115.1 esterase [Methylovulum psychrotolerans]
MSLHTSFGESVYEERVVPFTAADGLALNLINLRGQRKPHKCPVLLVHGAGVRGNIFRAPVTKTIVDALIEEGYDVWLENWRASIAFPPNLWTLDQAALYDHPQAVYTLLRETRADEIKAIIHCQGSTSFTMSAIAGLVPDVTTIISNAVSLHPIVPCWSRFKLQCLVPIVGLMTDYLNPHWGVYAPNLIAKFITLLVNLTHHECHNAVCKQVSFTYGSGFPALWRHENLNEATHEWLKEEFGAVPLRFFAQITRCIQQGHLVAVEDLEGLPDDFTAAPPKTAARFAFFAGEDNLCFLPDSQTKSHAYFSALRSNYHTLHRLPNYGHLDMFMGKNAAQDVFPLMLQELAK